jgi:hypothetical protein
MMMMKNVASHHSNEKQRQRLHIFAHQQDFCYYRDIKFDTWSVRIKNFLSLLDHNINIITSHVLMS